jgi:acetyl esterase/lipase
MSHEELLGPQQVDELPSSPPDHRVAYGPDPSQYGELRLPKGSGNYPVAVVIHGGCWKAHHGKMIADLRNTAALASALTANGIATWNIEYRRIDNPGGGWTGTFEDIARAVDFLRTLALTHALDLRRALVVGHSAGGHLGTWAAARHRLPPRSALHGEQPLPITGVINLAGPADLESFWPLQSGSCGDQVITRLVGGSPSEVPERYAQASPARLMPIGVKQILITGAEDSVVPPALGADYEKAARAEGDDVHFTAVPKAGHFEVIAPGSTAWPHVERALWSLLNPPG